MSKKEILSELNIIFCEVFDDKCIELKETSNSSDIEDWDSLAQIDLIIAIEDRFGIKVTLKEANGMEDVGEMVKYIFERIV